MSGIKLKLSSDIKWDPYDRRIVSLDVGGTVFKSTVCTLTRYSDWFRMTLSGHDNMDEALFIDRDPDIFKQVLAYMRDPLHVVTCSVGDIRTEFVYYGMKVHKINMMGIDSVMTQHINWAEKIEQVVTFTGVSAHLLAEYKCTLTNLALKNNEIYDAKSQIAMDDPCLTNHVHDFMKLHGFHLHGTDLNTTSASKQNFALTHFIWHKAVVVSIEVK